MTKTKRIVSILLAILLFFSVAACDSTPAVSDPESETVSAESSAADATTPDEESEEAESAVDVSDAESTDAVTSDTDAASDGAANTDTPVGGTTVAGGTTAPTQKPTASTTKKGTTATTKPAVVDKITFDELDLLDLSKLKEAPGADSGENGTLYVIDVNNMRARFPDFVFAYDAIKFTVSLQGLENRDEICMYVNDGGAAMNWATFFRAQQDGLLYGKKIVNLKTIDDVINKLGDRIKAHGIVLWDPDQPFTSNIATNVCGVEGYLPVMYSDDEDSTYMRLVERFGDSIVKMDLRGKFIGQKGTKIWDTNIASSGSAKCDAYLWAMEKYVKTDKTSKAYIAYLTDFYPLTEKGNGFLDGNSIYETCLPNQDYIVAERIFTFDLSVWGDEPATDDPTQPAGLDYQTLKTLLEYQYERNNGKMSQCIGFPPFVYKYTVRVGGKHDDTAVEWETVEVMTAYNIAVQADCPGPSSLFNCSVFSQYEQQATFSQKEKREKALSDLPSYDKNTYYLYIYMGDYDAVSWTYHIAANRLWNSPDRGELPLAWAFNPNLSERIPMVWDLFYATATDNDYFVGGDSGAGYVNPTLMLEGQRQHSYLPEGLTAWAEWCTSWYKKYDITITGMILNGNNVYPGTDVLSVYQKFSPDGIGVWNWPNNDSGMSVVNGTGVSGMSQYWAISQLGTAEEGANSLIDIIDNRRNPRFYPIKCCIINPTLVKESVELAQQKLDAEGKGRKIEVVDPYTFFAMIARQKEK